MGKFICEEGEFKCSICGTIYPFSDLRDVCEGRAWYLDGPSKSLVLDNLKAEVGERVIRTQYHGDDYAQAPQKAGIFLTWEWVVVRKKRVVPALFGAGEFLQKGHHYHHEAQYWIGEPDAVAHIVGDTWEEPASGAIIGGAIGPYHFWSQRFVEDNLQEQWPDYVFGMCVGERTEELLQAKKAEGYAVFV